MSWNSLLSVSKDIIHNKNDVAPPIEDTFKLSGKNVYTITGKENFIIEVSNDGIKRETSNVKKGFIEIEIFEKIKDLDCMVIPIGGGGLISSISIVAKKINPKIKIFGVESDLYPSNFNKFKDKNLNCSGDTIADGIAVKKPGE